MVARNALAPSDMSGPIWGDSMRMSSTMNAVQVSIDVLEPGRRLADDLVAGSRQRRRPRRRPQSAIRGSVGPPGGLASTDTRRGRPDGGVASVRRARSTGRAGGGRRGPTARAERRPPGGPSGPSTGMSWNDAGPSTAGMTVQLGTRPADGLSEAMPQHVAGLRNEPPMSLPSPIGLMPEAIAEASPPEEPPAVRVGSHGLRVRPNSDESEWTRSAMSGQLVRPIGIAPALRMRSTTGESIGGSASANAGSPQLVEQPTWSMFCFTVHGTP